jgi:hypothetical protein
MGVDVKHVEKLCKAHKLHISKHTVIFLILYNLFDSLKYSP